jgi:hypothetical protein
MCQSDKANQQRGKTQESARWLHSGLVEPARVATAHRPIIALQRRQEHEFGPF